MVLLAFRFLVKHEQKKPKIPFAQDHHAPQVDWEEEEESSYKGRCVTVIQLPCLQIFVMALVNKNSEIYFYQILKNIIRYPRQTARFQPGSARPDLEMLMVMREIEKSIMESITNRALPFQGVSFTQSKHLSNIQRAA